MEKWKYGEKKVFKKFNMLKVYKFFINSDGKDHPKWDML